MRVIALHNDNTFEEINLRRNQDLEVASWEIIGDCITSGIFNKDMTLHCYYDDAFGYNIIDSDALEKYVNKTAATLFNSDSIYNTVVICGYRNGRNCDIRKRDIKQIEAVIANAKANRGIG